MKSRHPNRRTIRPQVREAAFNLKESTPAVFKRRPRACLLQKRNRTQSPHAPYKCRERSLAHALAKFTQNRVRFATDPATRSASRSVRLYVVFDRRPLSLRIEAALCFQTTTANRTLFQPFPGLSWQSCSATPAATSLPAPTILRVNAPSATAARGNASSGAGNWRMPSRPTPG